MLDFLRRMFGPDPSPAPAPRQQSHSTLAPYQLRVSMIVHDPVLEVAGGLPLSRAMRWHDPDTLARQYIDDMRTCSGGLASYEIVERITVDGYPVKADGFVYDDTTYLQCWQQRGGFHMPDNVDYGRLLDEFGLVDKINRDLIDEVWLFAFPYAGYYESTMAGPGAFWCNSPPIPSSVAITSCRRRFVIMGFNFERDVGCMLENFGHRTESIMRYVYRQQHGERNLWSRFTRFDRDTPGRAECGTVHFAPNSLADYDWGNRRSVLCQADSWYTFPDLTGPPRPMNCSEWGNGDMRSYHLWWLGHIPRVTGETDGVRNNWWHYLLLPDDT